MLKRIALALALVSTLTLTFAGVVLADDITVSPGDSIQAAIDAASDGDTIFVSEGTYEECLVINDVDLALIAQGDVTIEPPAEGCDSATVEIIDAEASLNGFAVDGDHLGIYAHGDVAVTLEDNTVYDYAKNGITVIGTQDNFASANVVGNTVIGRGKLPYGDFAQNGIQFTWTNGLIKRNTVSDNWYEGGYWTATNVLVYAFDEDVTPIPADVQVLDNDIVDGQTGVYVYASEAMINGNTIKGEKYGPLWGIYPPPATCTYDDCSENYYEYGSSGVLLYGDNNKVVLNHIGPYDVGVEAYLANNKLIRNTFVDCVEPILNEGSDTKIHASLFAE